MYIRFLGLLIAVAGAVAVGSAQQQPAAGPARKVRMNDVPTPGTFGGLRREARPRMTIDASGINAAIPNAWETDPATGAQYRRGEVLVRFRDGVSPALRQRAMDAGRARRVSRILPGNWTLLELQEGIPTVQSLATLRATPEVATAALNFRVRPNQARPNDEFYSLQWNFDAINLPNAWQINPGARTDVVVAVIDTGLNVVTDTFTFDSPIVGQIPVRFAAVPDLVSDDRIVDAYDFIYDDEFPVDLGGHGTHVAGTIAQQTNNSFGVAGVAYNVKLMPLKVISGGGSLISWDDIFAPGNLGGSVAIVADAIRYAADNGAKVINLSLGGEGSAPALRDAISYAVSRGAFVAIAAGNSGDGGNPEEYPAAYGAEIKGAMTVGAVNRALRRSYYSSFHPYVEICAPGGEVEDDFDFDGGVTQMGYEEDATLSFLSSAQKIAALRQGFRPRFDLFELRPFQGTSMATPHVSGVAALLYSQGITNPAAIEEAIRRFAMPIQARADECGAGLVDARRALRGLGLAR
jgi:serine protease